MKCRFPGSVASIVALTFALLASAHAATTPLPALEADSLGGKHLRFPADAKGKPAVLIVAYDRSASDALENWSHKVNEKAGGRTQVFAVVDAAGAPFFVHGAIKSGVAKSAPSSQPQHQSNILVTFDGRGWDQLAPAGARNDAAAVVIDAEGNIVYARRGPYSDAALNEVVRAIPP